MQLVDLPAPAEEWLEDHEPGFQPDGSPTLSTLANAIQCWSLLQADTPVKVAVAALAFNIPPARVQAAVEWHPWMFLGGEADPDATIEHEGE